MNRPNTGKVRGHKKTLWITKQDARMRWSYLSASYFTYYNTKIALSVPNTPVIHLCYNVISMETVANSWIQGIPTQNTSIYRPNVEFHPRDKAI